MLTVSCLDSEEYFVDNVEAVYISQEYIEELSYNTQSNVFFGHTLAELDEQFQGKRYIFTLGENGTTDVQELVELQDETCKNVCMNVAKGAGVILICLTVSIVSDGLGAPAVSLIFASAAKSGTLMGLEAGGIGFVAASIARGFQTGDFGEAMKAGSLRASEDFKFGFISGTIIGGGAETYVLKRATLNGLTMNEAAVIQKATKWPMEAIENLHSISEFEIYEKAKLNPVQYADGQWAFVRDIDWNLVDEWGRTNVERVNLHYAPIDSSGMPYELHHIGQRADSPLAILTNAEHHSKDNFSILHYAKEGKNVTDVDWAVQKKEFWQMILETTKEAR